MADLGAVVAVTGDHGMSDKSRGDGTPCVLFLQEELKSQFGRGSVRVMCPITDPFVKHHGALGSFVRIYTRNGNGVETMLEYCEKFPEVELALTGSAAASRFEMPLDLESDIVVIAAPNAVIGSSKAEHNLSQLDGQRLRSHGGLSEQWVPLILSKPVSNREAAVKREWRNFDIFDLALNWSS